MKYRIKLILLLRLPILQCYNREIATTVHQRYVIKEKSTKMVTSKSTYYKEVQMCYCSSVTWHCLLHVVTYQFITDGHASTTFTLCWFLFFNLILDRVPKDQHGRHSLFKGFFLCLEGNLVNKQDKFNRKIIGITCGAQTSGSLNTCEVPQKPYATGPGYFLPSKKLNWILFI